MIRHIVRMSVPFVVGLMAANTAWADPCPESFSFADFGQVDVSGGINPGGPTFQVARNGQTLLQSPPSCHSFSGENALLNDNNGDPIPLVRSLGFAPDNITADVDEISLTRVQVEATSLDVLNEITRAAAREDPTIERTVGDGFVCYSRSFATLPSLICDVDNPFDGNKPIYLSCTNGDCSVAGIVMTPDLIARTSWTADYTSAMAAGLDAVQIVSDIHLFLINQMVEP